MSRKVSIIMYHYVRNLKISRYPEIKGLDYELFLQQIDFIRKNYTVVAMEDVISAVKTGEQLPDRAVLLTFDDGYLDHFVTVYPILRKFGLPGSFFVPSKALMDRQVLDVNKIHLLLASSHEEDLLQKVFAYLDSYRAMGHRIPDNDSLYQELAAANLYDNKNVIFIKRILQTKLPETLRNEITAKLFEESMGLPEEVVSSELYMNLEQIKMMQADGMYFGLHGHKHYWLGNLSHEDMEQDIQEALAFYNGVINQKEWVMNYPYGSFNQQVIEHIRKSGCVLGLTTERRIADLDRDGSYTLPRLDTNDYPPKSERYREFES